MYHMIYNIIPCLLVMLFHCEHLPLDQMWFPEQL